MDINNMQQTERLFGAILGDVELARQVTEYLAKCSRIPTKGELMRFRGIGESTADKILACCELSARYVVGTEAVAITAPEILVSRYLCSMKYEAQESMMVVTLDAGNHVIGTHRVTTGLVNQTPAAPREVFRVALMDNAVSVIIAHNHPSGSCEPSKEDISLTRLLCAAGKIMKIPVLDHIVVAKSGFTSICRMQPEIFEEAL